MDIKGIIVAAGYGTRFLPASKTVPKELLPLFNIPAIEFIVREMLEAGIKDILIISSRRKKALEDYFDIEVELSTELEKAGKLHHLEKIKPLEANIFFVRQKKMRGTADALYIARDFIGNSPFVVAFPDDVYIGDISLSREMVDIYIETKKNVLVVEEVPQEEVSRYGIISPGEEVQNFIEVKEIVEKPPTDRAPSNLAAFGRYLLLPEIFEYIEEDIKNHSGEGEIYHTNSINKMAKEGKVVAIKSSAKRYDLGEPLAYYKANFEYIIEHTEYGKEFINFIKGVIDGYQKEE